MKSKNNLLCHDDETLPIKTSQNNTLESKTRLNKAILFRIYQNETRWTEIIPDMMTECLPIYLVIIMVLTVIDLWAFCPIYQQLPWYWYQHNVKLLAMSIWGLGVGNTVWLRLQSNNVKFLAMVLVYSSGGGNHSHFWSKTFFSAQTTFTMLITGPLSYRTGNKVTQNEPDLLWKAKRGITKQNKAFWATKNKNKIFRNKTRDISQIYHEKWNWHSTKQKKAKISEMYYEVAK